MSDKYIVIVPPPTPNGDLHVGHFAGPFLASDVFARARRAAGDEVLYTTGTDDSQSYVVTTAVRRGVSPGALCKRSTDEIRESLEQLQIGIDGFAPFDAEYRTSCLDFLTELFEAGKFVWKDKEFFVRANGEAVYEAYVKGSCPTCLALTSGGLCESCGHPNNFTEILEPFAALGPNERLGRRVFRILVFELEQYRSQLEAYYAATARHLRPHIRRLMDEMFAGPLPDFPITYPGSWGLPAPFEGASGQVINAWAEGMPASMYCTAVAARRRGLDCPTAEALWRVEHGYKLIYFMGFDNSYFWGMSHLALLMAFDGRYIVPETMVTNEFYELENEKFSTSKGHVIWAPQIAEEYAMDATRFYLCWTNPEHHRTNFSRREMEKLILGRVAPAWQRLAENAGELLKRLPPAGKHLRYGSEGVRRVARMQETIGACYNPKTFSVRDAANLILMHIERLQSASEDLVEGKREFSAEAVGDIWHQLLNLLRLGSPVVTDWECAAGVPPAADGYAFDRLRQLSLPEFRLTADDRSSLPERTASEGLQIVA
jgi:methionyl-tRNA synthetase